MSFGRYAVVVTGTVWASMLAVWPLLRGAADPRAPEAAFFGGLLAALNALAAYKLVLWSSGRSNLAFMRAILGGMLARMMFLLGALVFAVLALGLPRVPLVISLSSYFVVFLVLELAVVQRATTPARASR